LQTEDEPAMSEMVESAITSHTYVAHVPVPSQKEVTCLHSLHTFRTDTLTRFQVL